MSTEGALDPLWETEYHFIGDEVASASLPVPLVHHHSPPAHGPLGQQLPLNQPPQGEGGPEFPWRLLIGIPVALGLSALASRHLYIRRPPHPDGDDSASEAASATQMAAEAPAASMGRNGATEAQYTEAPAGGVLGSCHGLSKVCHLPWKEEFIHQMQELGSEASDAIHSGSVFSRVVEAAGGTSRNVRSACESGLCSLDDHDGSLLGYFLCGAAASGTLLLFTRRIQPLQRLMKRTAFYRQQQELAAQLQQERRELLDFRSHVAKASTDSAERISQIVAETCRQQFAGSRSSALRMEQLESELARSSAEKQTLEKNLAEQAQKNFNLQQSLTEKEWERYSLEQKVKDRSDLEAKVMSLEADLEMQMEQRKQLQQGLLEKEWARQKLHERVSSMEADFQAMRFHAQSPPPDLEKGVAQQQDTVWQQLLSANEKEMKDLQVQLAAAVADKLRLAEDVAAGKQELKELKGQLAAALDEKARLAQAGSAGSEELAELKGQLAVAIAEKTELSEYAATGEQELAELKRQLAATLTEMQQLADTMAMEEKKLSELKGQLAAALTDKTELAEAVAADLNAEKQALQQKLARREQEVAHLGEVSTVLTEELRQLQGELMVHHLKASELEKVSQQLASSEEQRARLQEEVEALEASVGESKKELKVLLEIRNDELFAAEQELHVREQALLKQLQDMEQQLIASEKEKREAQQEFSTLQARQQEGSSRHAEEIAALQEQVAARKEKQEQLQQEMEVLSKEHVREQQKLEKHLEQLLADSEQHRAVLLEELTKLKADMSSKVQRLEDQLKAKESEVQSLHAEILKKQQKPDDVSQLSPNPKHDEAANLDWQLVQKAKAMLAESPISSKDFNMLQRRAATSSFFWMHPGYPIGDTTAGVEARPPPAGEKVEWRSFSDEVSALIEAKYALWRCSDAGPEWRHLVLQHGGSTHVLDLQHMTMVSLQSGSEQKVQRQRRVRMFPPVGGVVVK